MSYILIVDDSRTDRLLAGRLLESSPILTGNGSISLDYAEDGQAALAKIENQLPDLIVTDLQMPQMNGLELVGVVRQKYPSVPIVLVTAHGSEEIALQALKEGAASYVPKRRLADELAQTIEQILAVAGTKQEQQRLVEESWTQTSTHFHLTNDLSLIAPLVTHIQENLKRFKLCEEYDLIRVGVALREAISNAIIHGNLEVDSAVRETNEAAYYNSINDRKTCEPYKSRFVEVVAEESRNEAVYIVRDEGHGFDVDNLPDPWDPENLEKLSGRGLLLIRTFMDTVEFSEKGSQIMMVKKRR